jgi:subtilisin family serine protease
MQTLPFRFRVGLPSVFALALLLNGCGGIGDSLKLQRAVLVKVPITQPIATGRARGWEFRHVLEAPRSGGRAGEWYVAWNNGDPLATGPFTNYWMRLFARAPEIADATYTAFHAYPVLIEPNKSFAQVGAKAPAEPKPGEAVQAVHSKYGSGTRLVINKMPSAAWSDNRQLDGARPGQFVVDPLWHLDDRHSQLARARRQFARPGEGISIGHLDNGLDGRHAATPMNLVRHDWRADAVGLLEYAQKHSRGECAEPPLAPELTGGTHGMGTIGLLAGSWVAIDEKTVPGGRIKGYYGWLGGAPFARVVPVRIAPWVFSANTGELAYGIDYASRVQRCDVISMSHGGSPTQAWADAVNAAYERGTAIFAAESDYVSIIADPLRPKGIVLPASPVYPAAFRRAVGVTGVTADERSYARNTLGRLLRAPLAFKDWIFRGSYGADGTNTSLLHPSPKPDSSQIFRNGRLRPEPVAGYSPNVPWLSIREKDQTRYADGVDLEGAGTSASTPQVAAAAALWLQKHRGEFSPAEWHGWQKSEAVYQALLKTADRHGKPGPDPYLGAGSLRAHDALQVSLAELKSSHAPKGRLPDGRLADDQVPPDSLWWAKAPNDYFDGERSFLGILGLQAPGRVPISQRAMLRQTPVAGESRTDSLQRLYYNMMLLREWHGGDTPRKGREEEMYCERAWRKAENAPAPKSGRIEQ